MNVHYGDVLIKYGSILDVESDEIPYITTGKESKKQCYLSDGDVIIADTAEDETVGKCTEIINTQNAKIEAGLHTIPCHPRTAYAPMFLGYYMNSPYYHKQLIPLMQGVKVLSVSKSNIGNTLISAPVSYSEQEKIVDLLHLLDCRMRKQQEVIDSLKKYKRGSLSALFPKKGEITPQYRFAGFTKPWEQRKLRDFGKATGGTSIESEFSKDGVYKVINIGSYSESSVYNDQGIRAIKSDKTSNRVLNKNDLTMILNDKTASGNIIGRVLLIEKSGVYVYNQRTERIEINIDKYDSIFLYEMLNAPNIREKIIKQAQGNTQIYVNWTTIASLDYMIPSRGEQIKIGEYLHSLTNLITLHQHKYDILLSLKNALLQQLFI